MKRLIICALLAAGMALPAFGQDAGGSGQDDQPRARRGDRPGAERRRGAERRQNADGDEVRRGRRGGGEGMEDGDGPRGRRGRRGFDGERGGPGGPGAFTGAMFGRIADELDLDDEQRVVFDEITANARDEMRERMELMRERVDEMRAAVDSGNSELADEIRRELEESRNPREMMDNTIAELEPHLRPEQITRLHEMRSEMQRREQSRDFYRRTARDLPDELDMTEEQRAQYDDILNARREAMRGRFDEMRPLFDEMRAAREAGDMARVDELRAELRANRPDENALQDDFFAEVEGILTDEQKAALADFRAWNAPEGEAAADAVATEKPADKADVRDVIRAARRVRLAPDQKDELKEIEREAMGDYRTARRDPAKAAELAERVKAQVLELLDDDQTADFEDRLDGGPRRAKSKKR